MNLGVILPGTKLYGGIKRFFELGNVFVELGHRFTVYVPEVEQPDWFTFKGEIKPMEALKTDSLDAIFTTESIFLEPFLGANAKRRIFYHVSNDKQMKVISKMKEVEVLACSTNVYEHDKKYGLEDFKAFGGINLANYTPKEHYDIPADRPIHILAYGRLGMKCKGTRFIVKACEALYRKKYNIKLLLFDTPTNEKGRRRIAAFKTSVPYEFILNQPIEKNSEMFNRADIFVAAEGRAGWSNTVAEAMACAVPVIATKNGTRDILFDKQNGLICRRNSWSIRRKIKTLIKEQATREKFGRKGREVIENFDWRDLAVKIEQYLYAPPPMR